MLVKPVPPKPIPRSERLPGRKHIMTLAAGFYCRNGGVLLCADREENDGISRREIDKISRIRRQQGSVFIAVAGKSSIISKLTLCTSHAIDDAIDLRLHHVRLIEESLNSTYRAYVRTDEDAIAVIVVVAFNDPALMPLLYRSEGEMLVPQLSYTAVGSGKQISDYLADRLYDPQLDKPTMTALGAFILREAEESTNGVGLGGDMIFIHEGNKDFNHIYTDVVKDIQRAIPRLGDAVWPYWENTLILPASVKG